MAMKVEKMAVREVGGLGLTPNLCKCAFCGQTEAAMHPIYHSIFRAKEVGSRGSGKSKVIVYDVDEYGFAIYTCDKCIGRHKRRLVLFWLVCWAWFAVCLTLCWLYCVNLASTSRMSAMMWMVATLGAVLVGGLVGISGLFDCYSRPWRDLAGRHPQVASWLNAGYKFERKDWPRVVRAGRDTESRGGPLKRRKHGMYVSYENYVWAGILQNFSNKGPIGDNVHEAEQIFKSQEERKEQYLRQNAKPSTPLKLSGKVRVIMFALLVAGLIIQIRQIMGYEVRGYVGWTVLMFIVWLILEITKEDRGRRE